MTFMQIACCVNTGNLREHAIFRTVKNNRSLYYVVYLLNWDTINSESSTVVHLQGSVYIVISQLHKSAETSTQWHSRPYACLWCSCW